MTINEDAASKADVDALTSRVQQIELGLQTNNAATHRIETNTKDLVEMFQAMSGAFTVLRGIGRLARPIGYIAGAVAAVLGAWAALKGLVK